MLCYLQSPFSVGNSLIQKSQFRRGKGKPGGRIANDLLVADLFAKLEGLLQIFIRLFTFRSSPESHAHPSVEHPKFCLFTQGLSHALVSAEQILHSFKISPVIEGLRPLNEKIDKQAFLILCLVFLSGKKVKSFFVVLMGLFHRISFETLFS